MEVVRLLVSIEIHACSNKVRIKRILLESKLLEGIHHQLFSDEAITLFLEEYRELLKESVHNQQSRRENIQAQLERVGQEIINLISCIKQGIISTSVTEALEKAEQEKQALQNEMNNLPTDEGDTLNLLPKALEGYKDKIKDLNMIDPEYMAEARQSIAEMTGGKIRLIPVGQDGLEAEISGDYAGMLAASQILLVAGAGFEPAAFRL